MCPVKLESGTGLDYKKVLAYDGNWAVMRTEVGTAFAKTETEILQGETVVRLTTNFPGEGEQRFSRVRGTTTYPANVATYETGSKVPLVISAKYIDKARFEKEKES